jgi:hypothetical protein
MTDDGFQLPMLLKVILVEDWHACQSTIAHLAFRSTETAVLVPLDDPSGLINSDPSADENADGVFFIPAGTAIMVGRPLDAFDGHYELVHCGVANCPSGQQSGSGSSESGSGGEICYPVTGSAPAFPIHNDPDFILGMKFNADGHLCWVRVPTTFCSGSGSG